MKILLFSILLPLALLTAPLQAAEFFVAPGGSDSGPGSLKRPFATLQRAQRAARARKGEAITVSLREGTYYLAAPLIFTTEDSGTHGAPVIYQAYKQEKPVISGGIRLKLTWTPYRDGILQAQTPANFVTDQLFVNGERQPMARYPNFDASQRILNGYAKDAFSPQRANRWADPRGGFMHVMHEAMWGDMHYVITGKNDRGELTYEGGWQNNRPAPMHPEYRFVENIFEELDAPGEWFHNAKTGTLYYYPHTGLDLKTAVIEGVHLRHLIAFQGTKSKPARFITLRGLTFRHAARTFMENKEPLLRSDWTTYRGGALFYNGAEDCVLEDCFLDQLGGNAVFISDYNRNITVRGCHIANAGANGVAFVGDPNAVRNGITWQGHNTFAAIDRTPGPKTDNYPSDCLVEDCLITLSGRVEKQTAGVEIDMARNITVRHCSIYDVPRAGINIGDGCWGGHVIEDCDIFDTVKETGDHGSFNSWGRDRFWGLEGVDLNTVTLGENKNLPLLDVVSPNTLRHNRWRCDHGWDIDLDDGSSHYILQNNLCLNGGLKNREGFYRVVENNVIVNNSFHPHVWYGASQDIFRHNIVFTPYRPIGMNAPWGKEVDFNLLHSAGATQQPAATLHAQSGRDAHSLLADAQFVRPAAGDYRVKAGSPALALGFQNFRMDNFGVVKPELKAIARTPEFPDPSSNGPIEPGSTRDTGVVEWQGAKIKNVVGLGEVSAAGLSGEIGVRIESAPTGSRAAHAGLRANDVILKVNGKPTIALHDFLKAWRTAPPGTTIKLDIRRDQKAATVEMEADSEIVLSPGDATVQGDGPHPVFDAVKDFMGSWTNAGAWLEWRFPIVKPGVYEVTITLAHTTAAQQNQFEVHIGSATFAGIVPNTGDWEQFATVRLGTLTLDRTAEIVGSLKPTRVTGAVMNLRSIMLRPQ